MKLLEEKNYTGIVPRHQDGKIIDTEDSITFGSIEEAKNFFSEAKQRLLNVNNWHKISGALSARFYLADDRGEEVKRIVKNGDHFKIDIPGPGSVSGDGYDWVRVEAVEEVSNGEIESIGIRVRPASNPKNNEQDVAHFYAEDSTSNFILTRENIKVTASVYDRNTKTNSNTQTFTDKLRDKAVGAGAISFFSKIQWTGLVKGLLKGTG